MNVKHLLFVFGALTFGSAVTSSILNGQLPDAPRQLYSLQQDVSYRSATDQTPYMRERCKLDVYYPSKSKEFATIVWFHAGGLKRGNKSVPKELREQGVAVVAVNYRLSPKVKSPVYIEDAAASVAWTMKNIEGFGGDPEKVFVSGHSAGGYLTSMIGLDKKYLDVHNVDANELAGLVSMSGQAITHLTVRSERGIGDKQPIIDEMAPLYHVRKDCAPMLIVSGDRELEMLGRYEENAYMWRMMQVVGNPAVYLNELDGFDHGSMAKPAFKLLLEFVKKQSKAKSQLNPRKKEQ